MQLSRLAARLAAMSADEIRVRAWQEAYKRWDLLSPAPPVKRLRPPAAAEPQFFFDTAGLDAIVRLLHRERPLEVADLRQRAQAILEHRFDLLGYRQLDYGADIDWHWDAVHNLQAPRKPWYRLHLMNFSEVGDSKVTAELSRHQHLVTLAQAYCLEPDARYVSEIEAQWRSWQQANPYPLGMNWAGSLEVAIRSVSWLWVRELLAGRGALDRAFAAELESALARNGRHIERYLSTYSSPNTHLIGEGVGLLFLGLLCPQLATAQRWRRQGWDIVTAAAQRQVLPDGWYFEQSVYYHVYALDFFMHARILAAVNGVEIPAEFDRTLERMLAALHLLASAGIPPGSGDDDGGRVFDPRRNRPQHMLDPLATGALLYRRPEWQRLGAWPLETVWLLGAEAVRDWAPATAAQPPLPGRLSASGFHVLAGGLQRLQMVLDAGPLGCGNAGHGHADALSLAMSGPEQIWLADPGTGCYLSDGGERAHFRGTAAHNTLCVDGCNQAEAAGPFAWAKHPRVTVGTWACDSGFSYFRGEHDGYRRLTQPVTHERRVFHLHHRFWLVYDRALGVGRHQLALHWQFGLGLEVQPVGTEGWRLHDRGGGSLLLLPERGHGWRQELQPGAVSPAYGCIEPAPLGVFTLSADLPVELATLLVPSPERDWVLERQPSSHAAVSSYEVRRGDERHRIVLADPGQTWSLQEWSSDAELLHFGPKPDGLQLIACGVSFVSFQGRDLLPPGPRRNCWEAQEDGAAWTAQAASAEGRA
ncbi:MAG: alginate lyase family protein [Terriglobales bacterium]